MKAPPPLSIIKELPIFFIGVGEVRNFEFTQLKATENAYLYEVNTGSSIYYEVFKRKVNKVFGNIKYPTSKHFGVWAWTCQNIEKAEAHFKRISIKTNIP